MTPLMLGLGVCAPMWLELSLPGPDCYAAALGILSTGVGDSMAGLVGTHGPFPHIKIPFGPRNKTIQGMQILSVCVYACKHTACVYECIHTCVQD